MRDADSCTLKRGGKYIDAYWFVLVNIQHAAEVFKASSPVWSVNCLPVWYVYLSHQSTRLCHSCPTSSPVYIFHLFHQSPCPTCTICFTSSTCLPVYLFHLSTCSSTSPVPPVSLVHMFHQFHFYTIYLHHLSHQSTCHLFYLSTFATFITLPFVDIYINFSLTFIFFSSYYPTVLSLSFLPYVLWLSYINVSLLHFPTFTILFSS